MAEIRFVQTYPGAVDVEGHKLLAHHRELTGHLRPGTLTPEEEAHRSQVHSVKVGWKGYPIWEFTCPACGIRWRND